MSLPSGSRLGPYEILAAIGAGGMGEVYRARDPRLGREVAIKVLPASFSADADRLRRFEQEARAAGILNHPNITAVHDIGSSDDGAPYVVQELLEGETLRAVLSGGRLSPRRAIDYSLQIVHGLAAAHGKGIVHRDLKPENIFVTNDGRVKILDFGLAKLTHLEEQSQATNVPTATAATEPGVILGTIGYMSPEQVKGKPADARSDIFSFGAILYEMLAGRRAFQGESAAETMSAILREDPPEISVTNQNVPPALDRIVRHCLEKSPEQRFHSAHDVAFNLEALSDTSAAGIPSALMAPRQRGQGRRTGRLAAAAVAHLALGAAGAWLAARRSSPTTEPTFRQLTFRRGNVGLARFTPDGQTMVFAAAWDGKPFSVYSMGPGSPDSSPLDVPPGAILAVGPSGLLALQTGRRVTEPYVSSGTLAETHLTGGEAPRERLHDVQWADWSPDGKTLAIVHDAGGRNRLESPVGTVLYETSGWIGSPRFSPSGDAIALLDHWARVGDMGTVVLVSLEGKATRLSQGWSTVQGLAWRRDGKEIWFTGTKVGGNRSLHAVDRSGRERLVFRQAGSLRLEDISRSGDVLLLQEEARVGLVGRAPGQPKERDLSWLDFSALRDLSSDGRKVLFDESGEAGGDEGTVFLRDIDGSAPVRLGTGFGMSLSPDERQVIASGLANPRGINLFPVGAGEPRRLTELPFNLVWAAWLPDGKGILLSGGEAGHGARLYVLGIQGGAPRPVSPEGVQLIPYTNLITPDGKLVPAIGPDLAVSLFPLGAGEPRRIPGLEPGELPCGWDTAAKNLFVYRPGELPARISRVDIETGARQPFIELMPGDPTGITFIRAPHFTRDGGAYAYSYARTLSTLYLVKGLK
jgi:hypothetical protein